MKLWKSRHGVTSPSAAGEVPEGRAGGLAVLLATALLAAGATSTEAVRLRVDRTDDTATATACQPLVIGDCSLRGAIIRANMDSTPDEIVLSATTYLLMLNGSDEDAAATGDLDILEPVTISVVGGRATINGQFSDRVFDIHGADVEISDLETIYGWASRGGGIRLSWGSLTLERVTVRNCLASAAGGIYSSATLTLVDSTVSHNTASGNAGGVANDILGTLVVTRSTIAFNSADGSAGGIWNSGQLTLEASTLLGNTAADGGTGGSLFHGGGLLTQGHALVDTCTFADNTAVDGWGGGIVNLGYSDLRVVASTFVGNRAIAGGAVGSTGGETTLERNLIVGDCLSLEGSIVSDGGNLESPGDTCQLNGAYDLSDVADPMLAELAYNGGGTLSFLPLPGSPAVDLDPDSCQPRDQRGFGRPRDGDGDGTAVCDAGSCERDPGHLFMDGFESGTTDAWG